jgi:Flp pilus assembly protein TadD
MKAEAYKLCPGCEARNKVDWEICVRCGEWLLDVEATSPEDTVSAAAPVSTLPLLGGLAVLAVLSGVIFAYFPWRMEPAKVDPRAFTFPTLPAPLPAPRPAAQPVANLREGRQLLLDGQTEDALMTLAEAVAAQPEDAQVRNMYAHALWQNEMQERAVVEFQKAAKLDEPAGVSFQHDYAKALAANGQTTDAISEYEKLVVELPRSARIRRDLAGLLFTAGQPERAIEELSSTLEIVPDDARLHEQLGYILDQSGRSAEALVAYGQAVELAPQDGVKIARLADLMRREGQTAEGIELLESGVARIPESPVLRRALGVSLEHAGRPRDAAAAYREYVRLAPQAADAQEVTTRADVLEQRASS